MFQCPLSLNSGSSRCSSSSRLTLIGWLGCCSKGVCDVIQLSSSRDGDRHEAGGEDGNTDHEAVRVRSDVTINITPGPTTLTSNYKLIDFFKFLNSPVCRHREQGTCSNVDVSLQELLLK